MFCALMIQTLGNTSARCTQYPVEFVIKDTTEDADTALSNNLT